MLALRGRRRDLACLAERCSNSPIMRRIGIGSASVNSLQVILSDTPLNFIGLVIPDLAQSVNVWIRQWFPLGIRFQVVLDPERRFGEPIDPTSGVPTASLAEAFHAENKNAAAAATWFNTSTKAVRDAVRFEQWLNQR